MSEPPLDGSRDVSKPAPGAPMVEISGVNKHFGDLHVLQDLSLIHI